MQKLPAVEQARVIMNEAKDWSVWRWLLEKRKVREAADRATDAFAEVEEKVKNAWSDELKLAYAELVAEAAAESDPKAKRHYQKVKQEAANLDPELKATAKKVKEADDRAYKARWDAEDIFAEAERHLNTGMAREGTHKALESYDLREKAIRRAEAAGKPRMSAAPPG